MTGSIANNEEWPDLGPRDARGQWQPAGPKTMPPLFAWPPRPLAVLRWLFGFPGYLWPWTALYILIAVGTWLFLQPEIARCTEFETNWIAQLYVRNLVMLVLIAGAWHLRLYTLKAQGLQYKYDAAWPSIANRKFLWDRQLWDNVFWSCVSGITIATVYEVFFMWSYANDLLPFYLDWEKHPIWFLFTVIAIPFWSSIHFYLIHRLLHWKPLYQLAHAVHHRNNNIGPWSGISMHPIEHIIYLSSILIHVVVASHPVHIFFHTNWNTIGAAISHTGFESITFRGKPIFFLGSFHHQLHHRLYKCNYGNFLVRCDKWFGTDHDGTPEAWANIQKRQHKKRSRAADNN